MAQIMPRHSLFISNSEVLTLKKAVFAVKFLIFVAIMIFLILYFIMPQYTTEYSASIIDKYHRLRSIDEPKIILVGDSNVAFGFDSEKIQAAFNMPVVNFGLHAGLGQTFYSEMVKKLINEGDIVVIIPIPYYDDTARIWDHVLAWVTIENHYYLWGGISSENYKDMLLAYPAYLKKAIKLFITNRGNKPVEGAYARAAFNEYGDNIFPRPEPIMTEDSSTTLFSPDLSQAIQTYWNNYNRYVTNKKAVLFMSSPPISMAVPEAELESLQQQLEELLDIPMISRLVDYVYPFEYSFDLTGHLNDFGKEVRTEQFISDLSNAVNRQGR
jgi:hypothetical protein